MKHPNLDRFTADVESHKLDIIKNDGVFRHLSISKPNAMNLSYEITTWPGYLCISGDMGCYTFRRTQDMFNFFRGKAGDINPSYWDEKIQGGAGYNSDITRQFDISDYHDRLNQYLGNFIEYKTDEKEDDWQEDITEAKEAVQGFKDYCEDSEWDAASRINNWDPDEAGGMSLDDFWDGCSIGKCFTYHYIWCCYAIVHAIKLFDEA